MTCFYSILLTQVLSRDCHAYNYFFTNINTDYIIVFMLFMVETFCTLVEGGGGLFR